MFFLSNTKAVALIPNATAFYFPFHYFYYNKNVYSEKGCY